MVWTDGWRTLPFDDDESLGSKPSVANAGTTGPTRGEEIGTGCVCPAVCFGLMTVGAVRRRGGMTGVGALDDSKFLAAVFSLL